MPHMNKRHGPSALSSRLLELSLEVDLLYPPDYTETPVRRPLTPHLRRGLLACQECVGRYELQAGLFPSWRSCSVSVWQSHREAVAPEASRPRFPWRPFARLARTR